MDRARRIEEQKQKKTHIDKPVKWRNVLKWKVFFSIFIFIGSIYELHYDSKHFNVVKVNHLNIMWFFYIPSFEFMCIINCVKVKSSSYGSSFNGIWRYQPNTLLNRSRAAVASVQFVPMNSLSNFFFIRRLTQSQRIKKSYELCQKNLFGLNSNENQ